MKYGGTLIHRVVDDYGPIEVVEAHGVRSLHFGTAARQSAIDLSLPDHIELTYIRSMLVPLLFVPRPRHILLLGLGGGTLARFFLRHFSELQIEAVELRAAVVAVAQDYFDLDLKPPLEIHVMDAHQYLEQKVKQVSERFDLILVDVFDAEGPSVVLDEPGFFSGISALMSPRGVMALNLWSGGSPSWQAIHEEIQSHFRGTLATLMVPGRGNRICVALGEAHGKLNLKSLGQEARTLEQRLGIEFVRLFERLEFPLRRSPNASGSAAGG